MPTQHTHMTDSPTRRSEDDLRAALASLEQLAPSRESVLRPAPGGGAPHRDAASWPQPPASGGRRGRGFDSRPHRDHAGRRTHIRPFGEAILTAFDSASGMVLESQATFRRGGPSPAAPCRGRADASSARTTARYRFVDMTSGGRPTSELAELYTAQRPDFSGLGARFVGSGGVTGASPP